MGISSPKLVEYFEAKVKAFCGQVKVTNIEAYRGEVILVFDIVKPVYSVVCVPPLIIINL